MDSFIKSDTLQSQSQELSAKVFELENQVEQLELQLARVKLPLFSIEKLKSDSSAKFYTGFPNLKGIFTGVLSSIKAQSQAWSENKQNNTWKVLIGISSSGLIAFVSKLCSF